MSRWLVIAGLVWASAARASTLPDVLMGVHDFRMVDPQARQCGGSMRVDVRKAGRGLKVSYEVNVSLLDLVGREEGTLVLDEDLSVKRRWVERDGQTWLRVRKAKDTQLRVTKADETREERVANLHPDHDGNVVELLLSVAHAAWGVSGGTYWRLGWPSAQGPATWSTFELQVASPPGTPAPMDLEAVQEVTLTRASSELVTGEIVRVHLEAGGRPVAMTAEGRRFVVVRADVADCGE